MLRRALETREAHNIFCLWRECPRAKKRVRDAILCSLALTMLAAGSARAAELPDAPSAVKAGQQQEAAYRALENDPALDASGRIPAFSLIASEFPASSVTNWGLTSGPFAPGRDIEGQLGQQAPYAPPKKQTAPPGFSSSLAGQHPVPGAAPNLESTCPPNACSLSESVMCCRAGVRPSPFARYLKSPTAVPLTWRANLHSAVKGVIDPFNLLTIAADSAIGVATDPHSVYGPGFDGFSKYAGVSLTEDMTGEFFGTFLVPSLVHQDPHYHREPFQPIERRILHAIVQVVWAQSYTGKPMFNYANIVGGIATAAVSNTFVPGPGRQGFGATAQRLAVAFAISPSGNLIEEFVPDIASRINLRVVIFQRILNTVSIEESGGGVP